MQRQSRWGLVCCLTLEWLALGVWVGGLLVLIGAVIPAVFNTFGGQDSGGFFLTRAFEGYNHFVIGALAILCAASWYRWWSGDQLVAVSRGEMMLLAGMMVIAGIIILWLHPLCCGASSSGLRGERGSGERRRPSKHCFRIHDAGSVALHGESCAGNPPDRNQGETVSVPGRSAHVKKALLALADGTIFEGRALGYEGETMGEVVFNTAMTGYQEVLTDPSYKGQIITMTSPHIGNYGMTPEDAESRRIWAEGFIVKEASRLASNWRSRQQVQDYLHEAKIVGIEGLDTRALTRHLREHGSQQGLITHVDGGCPPSR